MTRDPHGYIRLGYALFIIAGTILALIIAAAAVVVAIALFDTTGILQ